MSSRHYPFSPVNRRFPVIVTLIASLALLVTACAGSGESDDQHVTWDYFIFVPATHPIGLAAEQFAKEAEEATNGELEIKVRPVGELPFVATDALTAIKTGDVDMADGYSGFIAGNVSTAGVIGLPFLATNTDDGTKAVAALKPFLNEQLQKYDAELLFEFDWSTQTILGKGAPVSSPADLKGLKARATSPQQVEFLKTFGAYPTTLTTEEVPTAMNTGVIDTILTTPVTVTGSGWEQFIDWIYPVGVNPGMSFIVVNQNSLKELSPGSQEALKKLAADYGPRETASLSEQNTAAQKQLEEAGVSIAEPDPSDVERMTQEMMPYWERWASENNVEEALAAVRASLGK